MFNITPKNATIFNLYISPLAVNKVPKIYVEETNKKEIINTINIFEDSIKLLSYLKSIISIE